MFTENRQYLVVVAVVVALIAAIAGDVKDAGAWSWNRSVVNIDTYSLYQIAVDRAFERNTVAYGQIDRVTQDQSGNELVTVLGYDGLEYVVGWHQLQLPFGNEPGSEVIVNTMLQVYECTENEYRADSAFCWSQLVSW